MKVVVKRSRPETATADVLVVPVWQASSLSPKHAVAQLDTHLGGLISEYLDSGDFSGDLNSTMLLRTRGSIKAPRLLLVGLGKTKMFTVDHLRQVSASAVAAARQLGVATVAILPPACDIGLSDLGQAFSEGALLGLYRLKKYKTVPEDNDKDNLRDNWEHFFPHYHELLWREFWSSSIATWPRRTDKWKREASLFGRPCEFVGPYRTDSLPELQDWFGKLLTVEQAASDNHPTED